ncbi:MAG TPA: hypothetical protein VGR73_23100 [Bryobacteraceae bacterium]|nr:hypothetical protein [Bryobacteraceae bacterium]
MRTGRPKLAVARILGDGTRMKTRAFIELESHYLVAEKFGRPGKGNDKGKVEGLVGYVRRNFMPRPRFATWEEFNAHLLIQCQKRQGRKPRGHQQTVGERFEKDRERLLPLAAALYEACDKRSTRVPRWPWCAIAPTTTRCRSNGDTAKCW